MAENEVLVTEILRLDGDHLSYAHIVDKYLGEGRSLAEEKILAITLGWLKKDFE